MKLVARINRKFGHSWNGYLRGELETVDFPTDAKTDYDETDYGLGLAWNVRSTVHLDLTYRYSTRPSDSVDSFDENEVWLKAEWSPPRR
jgi:hypothetical protein